jgi:hypothetical protein
MFRLDAPDQGAREGGDRVVGLSLCEINLTATAPLVAAGGALTLSRCRHGEMVATIESRAGINRCISLGKRRLLCDVSQFRQRQPITYILVFCQIFHFDNPLPDLNHFLERLSHPID